MSTFFGLVTLLAMVAGGYFLVRLIICFIKGDDKAFYSKRLGIAGHNPPFQICNILTNPHTHWRDGVFLCPFCSSQKRYTLPMEEKPFW